MERERGKQVVIKAALLIGEASHNNLTEGEKDGHQNS